jgi:hypothetical protein
VQWTYFPNAAITVVDTQWHWIHLLLTEMYYLQTQCYFMKYSPYQEIFQIKVVCLNEMCILCRVPTVCMLSLLLTKCDLSFI